MTITLSTALATLQLVSLGWIFYCLTGAPRLTTSQRDVTRIMALTVLGLSSALHLALRFHLVV